VRSRFSLGRCALDADVASFGHNVLEIEVCCASASEISDAEAEIERVRQLVGAAPLDPGSGGKLEAYIRRHRPAVLQQLQEAGVLP
jgi:thiamine-triphosphatase